MELTKCTYRYILDSCSPVELKRFLKKEKEEDGHFH